MLVRLSFVDVGLRSFLVLFVDFASATIVVVAVASVLLELVVAVATVLFLFLFLLPLPRRRAIEFPPANSPECPSSSHVSLKTPVKKPNFASNCAT